jgi:hypothetical protein
MYGSGTVLLLVQYRYQVVPRIEGATCSRTFTTYSNTTYKYKYWDSREYQVQVQVLVRVGSASYS